MKQLTVFLIFLLSATQSFTQPFYVYTATKSGYWNDYSVWSIGPRVDGVNKTKVVIPAAYTLNVDNGVNSFGLGDVEIYIYGNLNIIAGTNINLTSASSVDLLGTGNISGTNNTQLITLGGVVKYDGSKDFTKVGPSIANSASGISPNGFFAPIILPVKLTSFNVHKTTNDIAVKWITASEVSNDHFDVERSYDGNTWNTIGSVKGSVGTAAQSSYSFTDNSSKGELIYYRLKQVDINGGFSFSEVKSIASENQKAARIYVADNTIKINLPEVTTSRTLVTVMNSNGQVLLRKSFGTSNNFALTITDRSTGVLLVNVSDNKQINQTTRLIL